MLSSLALCISVGEHWVDALRFYFWSGAVFMAALPLLSWAFLTHLCRPAVFHRTPKHGDRERLALSQWLSAVLFGVAAVVLSFVWYSPFSPVLAGKGLAFLSFPLYAHLGEDSATGQLARVAVFCCSPSVRPGGPTCERRRLSCDERLGLVPWRGGPEDGGSIFAGGQTIKRSSKSSQAARAEKPPEAGTR